VGTNIAKTNETTLAVKAKINEALSLPISSKDSLSYLQASDVEIVNGEKVKTLFV
jgi:hypothetical protein